MDEIVTCKAEGGDDHPHQAPFDGDFALPEREDQNSGKLNAYGYPSKLSKVLSEQQRSKEGCEHGNRCCHDTGCCGRDGGHRNIEEDLIEKETQGSQYQKEGDILYFGKTDAFDKSNCHKYYSSRPVPQQTQRKGPDVTHGNAREDKARGPKHDGKESQDQCTVV